MIVFTFLVGLFVCLLIYLLFSFEIVDWWHSIEFYYHKLASKVTWLINCTLHIVILMSRKKRLRTNDMQHMNAAEKDAELGSIKLFKCVRLKCMNKSERLAFQLELSNRNATTPTTGIVPAAADVADERTASTSITFGIPTKRSGHRAVCDEGNLWIWGGFCPTNEFDNEENDDDDNENEKSPLYPEVCLFIQLFIFKNETR